jgi:probable rRNA maturation factor
VIADANENVKHEIFVSSMVRKLPLSEKRITVLVELILSNEKVERAEISIAIVGDKRMADYAEQYAKRRYRTDVFAFNLEDEGDELLIGQLIVNSQLAREKASKLKVPAAAELALYITHGVLHLCGYDDHEIADAQDMHKKTRLYLEQAGFKKLPPMPIVSDS